MTASASVGGTPVARRAGSRRRRRGRGTGRWVTVGSRPVFSKGLPRRFWQDLYHLCMTISWPALIAILAALFVTVNGLFGLLYSLMPGSVANLMLRAANARQNVIVEASAHLRLVREEVSSEGFKIRRIRELALVRDQNPVFVLGWTLMHVIDETSPLAGETHDSLAAAQGQLVLSLIGIDETTGQDVTARATYQPHALRWNHAFQDVLETDEEGDDVVDFTRFHDVVPLAPAG